MNAHKTNWIKFCPVDGYIYVQNIKVEYVRVQEKNKKIKILSHAVKSCSNGNNYTLNKNEVSH